MASIHIPNMKDFFLPILSEMIPEIKIKKARPHGKAAFIMPICVVLIPILRRYILNITKKMLNPIAARRLLIK